MNDFYFCILFILKIESLFLVFQLIEHSVLCVEKSEIMMGIVILNTEYSDMVNVNMMIPSESKEKFIKKIVEAKSGKVQVTMGDTINNGLIAGEGII